MGGTFWRFFRNCHRSKGSKINLNCIQYSDKKPEKNIFQILGASELIDPQSLLHPQGFMRVKFQFGRFTWVMCILTSKQVICKPFAGWNHLSWHLNIFFHLIKENRRLKQAKCLKNTLKDVYQLLGSFFALFLPFFLF